MIRFAHSAMFITLIGIPIGAAGCTKHTVTVEPIRVEPIHLTIDVNVRVDRELDEFFDYKKPPPLPDPAVGSGSVTPPAGTTNGATGETS